MKCKRCNMNDIFQDKKYCEDCYNVGLYLLAIYKDSKEGIISEDEANLLAKQVNEGQ